MKRWIIALAVINALLSVASARQAARWKAVALQGIAVAAHCEAALRELVDDRVGTQ